MYTLTCVLAGRINGANPPTLGTKACGFASTTVTHTGTGVWTFNINEPVAEAECVVVMSGVGIATSPTFAFQHTNTVTKVVNAFIAGAASDTVNVDLILYRLPSGQ